MPIDTTIKRYRLQNLDHIKTENGLQIGANLLIRENDFGEICK
jgi:hypothetical protein